ncbi:MAG: prephenate dehydrogenase/arogenate dehydrogenase family protein [Rhodocyclaceae bacterium]|nr:prephenate dehydrogenase/arogenate dehydrogenase family protein [Rhodocyclaceae bacterium]
MRASWKRWRKQSVADFKLNKVVVYGVGLIGGSFALALKQADGAAEIVGLGRSTASLEIAQGLGVIDRVGDLTDVRDADLVLLAMPVGKMEAAMLAIAPHLGAKTVVVDAGSTKQDVVAAARRAFGSRIAQFVPCHPIAGAEKSGASAAQAGLYIDKRIIVTPLPENTPFAIAIAEAAWTVCGGDVSVMAPAQHDAMFAAVSHLPHLLAFTLVDEFAKRPDAAELFGNAGSGFRDFTRIAGSHPEMWRDISVANRAALITELDRYMNALLQLRVLLAGADAEGLERLFTNARDTRNFWLDSIEK